MQDGKIIVTYFQRKPHPNSNFSIEQIFNDLRNRLADRIVYKIHESSFYNTRIFNKIFNIIEVAFRSKSHVCHITGENHYLNFLINRKKVILTIHDCGMMLRKKGLERFFVKQLYLNIPVKKSAIITTVSNATKQDIIYYTGCSADKIRVIPVAVNSSFTPNYKAFNKVNPNILQIGTSYNKNIERLIVALTGIPCHLTVIGHLTPEQIALLEANGIAYSNYSGLSLEDMILQYEQADIVSFVSTSEGFGMPIIEANIVERVVITSNVSSMPEVAGDAACLVDPFEIEDIRDGFIRIIEDEMYRDNLIKNGRINRERFNPELVANQYYELYRSILKEKVDN